MEDVSYSVLAFVKKTFFLGDNLFHVESLCFQGVKWCVDKRSFWAYSIFLASYDIIYFSQLKYICFDFQYTPAFSIYFRKTC